VNSNQGDGKPITVSTATALMHPRHKETREFVRFTRHERATHGIMIITFIALSLTGLTLKFSYTDWAAKVSVILGGFQTCGYIHRTAAVIMFFNFASHLIGLARKRHRKYTSWTHMVFGENSMIPGPNDWREFVATLKWFVGMGERPSYGRWTYWEKFDYFAVFWGIFVIGSTGLTLWFPVFFTRFLPGWFLNVSTIVHSDEALLATGFIFTVHFFNTHFRPEKFPMDTVIFTGRVSDEELREERPEEFERLERERALDRLRVDAPKPWVLPLGRTIGTVAVCVGLTLVVLIVYAVLTSGPTAHP